MPCAAPRRYDAAVDRASAPSRPLLRSLTLSLLPLLLTACGADDAPVPMETDPSGTSGGSASSTTAPSTTAADGSTSTTADPSTTDPIGTTTDDTDDTGTSGGEVIEQLDVLFIGNSHTYLDDIDETDLPQVVAELAESQGKTLVVDSVTAPFASLEEHYNDGEALDLIALGGWDVVVLQERYLPAVEDPVLTTDYALLFRDEIDLIGADTMIYVLWAREDELRLQSTIVDNAAQVAASIGAELSPVGPAWEKIRTDYPTMTLAQNDPQSHANRRGAYLSAVVFYGALFLETPLGLPAQTILDEDPTEAEAELLQLAAEEALTEL